MNATRYIPKRSILLIGRGKWSANILHTLQHIGVDVIHISAREALDDLIAFSSNGRVADLIRTADGTIICTQPNIQARLVAVGSEFFRNLMLEKPLACDWGSLNIYTMLAKSRYTILIDHLDEVQSTTQKIIGLESGLSPIHLYARLNYPYPSRENMNPLFEYSPHLLSLTQRLFGSSVSFEIIELPMKFNFRAKERQASFLIKGFLGTRCVAMLECGNAYPFKVRESVFSFEDREYLTRDRQGDQLWSRTYDSLDEESIPFDYVPPLRNKLDLFLAHVAEALPRRNELSDAIKYNEYLLRVKEGT